MITAQQLTRYYDEYRDTEVSFTKDIIRALAMDPRQIYLKCTGSQWPCIVSSSSFQQAKVVLGTKGGAFQEISKKEAQVVSIKYTFHHPDGQDVSFFISGKVSNIATAANGQDLAVATIQYTQRPPDDFLELLGNLLDANANAARYKDEHIPINADTLRKINMQKKECVVNVQGVPRNCILSDLSFSKIKVILLGIAQFLVNKEANLALEFEDPHEVFTLKGVVASVNPVEGRKDICVATIEMQDADVPLNYKIRINNHISTVRKAEQDRQAKADQEAVQAAMQAQRSAAKAQAAPAAAQA